MGMLDWISDAADYVGSAASSVVDSVSSAASSIGDWVSDWFDDDTDSIDVESDDYSIDGEFGSYLSTDDESFSDMEFAEDAELANGDISLAADAAGEGGLLGALSEDWEGYDYALDAADITTDKSTLYDEALESSSGDSKSKKEDADKEEDGKDKGWWSETKDVVKSEGGAALIGGLAKGAYAMLTEGDDQKDALELLEKKSELEKELYKFKYDTDNQSKSSRSSSSSKSSSSDDSSGSDRIKTLANAYPVKTNFTRS